MLSNIEEPAKEILKRHERNRRKCVQKQRPKRQPTKQTKKPNPSRRVKRGKEDGGNTCMRASWGSQGRVTNVNPVIREVDTRESAPAVLPEKWPILYFYPVSVLLQGTPVHIFIWQPPCIKSQATTVTEIVKPPDVFHTTDCIYMVLL